MELIKNAHALYRDNGPLIKQTGCPKRSLVAMWRHTGSDEWVTNQHRTTTVTLSLLVQTKTLAFQIFTVWRAFSKSSVFDHHRIKAAFLIPPAHCRRGQTGPWNTEDFENAPRTWKWRLSCSLWLPAFNRILGSTLLPVFRTLNQSIA